MSAAIVMTVAFIVFLCYYLGGFFSVANHRHSKKVGGLCNVKPQPVSVIVVVNNDLDYIENRLPLLLEQEYKAPYQVVVVCDTPEGDHAPEMLEELAAGNDRLYVTVIPSDHKFHHTNKLALTVGMKAAIYDNVIVTSSEAAPVSTEWLSMMSYGFTSDHALVSGYNRIGRAGGFFNKLQRAINMHESLMMLARAVAGRPYRVSRHNSGQSKALFFANRGFTDHLRLNVGESDLYIQQIAPYAESNVIINPKGITESVPYEKVAVWYNRRKFFSYPFRFFRGGARFYIAASYLFTALFWVSSITLAVISSSELRIAALSMIALRWIVIMAVTARFSRRTGDKAPHTAMLLYDFISPAEILLLTASRNILSLKNLWI